MEWPACHASAWATLKPRLAPGAVCPGEETEDAGGAAALLATDALLSLAPTAIPLGPLHPGALESGAMDEAVIAAASPTPPVPADGGGVPEGLPDKEDGPAEEWGGAAPPAAEVPAAAP